MAEAQLPVWNSTAVRVGTPSSRSNEDAGPAPTRCYHAGNWLLLALFALALASAGMSVRLFIVPCEKKTEYTTHNTSTIINVTSFENVSVLENVRSRRGTPTRLPTPSTRRRRISTRERDGARAKTQYPDAGYGD